MTDPGSWSARVLRGALGSLPKPSLFEWLALLVGVFLVMEYAWLLDDAFVYFRYADNFLFLKLGLVYNRSEYVEGFSSPVWMMMLVLARATETTWWIITRVLGVGTFVLTWYLLVALNRRLSPAGSRVVNVPLCVVAFHYSVLSYFTSGLETPLVQLLAPCYALFFLNPGSGLLQVLVGVSPMVRHELALPFALAVFFAWWTQHRFPRLLVASFLVPTTLWGLVRVSYYADLFPTTFYLKDTTWYAQGWTYVHDLMWPYGHYFLFGALLVLAAWLGASSEMRPRLQLVPRAAMVVTALVMAAYVVRIGGDARHYRYLAFPFVLLLCSGAGLIEHAMLRLPVVARRTAAFLVSVGIATATALCYPRQLLEHPLIHANDGVLMGEDRYWQIVDKIMDAAAHRHYEGMALPRWGAGDSIELLDDEGFRRAMHMERFLYDDIDVGYWCATNYLRFRTRWVHSLGLTDPVLARIDVPFDRPAHKYKLIPFAEDLKQLRAPHQERPRPGMARASVEAGHAPEWMVKNLASIEAIERKMYNRHRFFENLRQVFVFPARIVP